MSDRSTRSIEARVLWRHAERLHADGRIDEAWQACQDAHDRVTDDVAAHEEAHRRLLPLDVALGRTRDARVDRALLATAPWSFRMLAVLFRLRGGYDRLPPVPRELLDAS